MSTIKPGQKLISLSYDQSAAVMTHPAQQATASTVAQLITWLRECDASDDFYEFQQHLFGYLYGVEERRDNAHAS